MPTTDRSAQPRVTPREPADPELLETTSRNVRNLAAATRRLSATIQATERLAEGNAEVLRTMDAAVGLKSRPGSGRVGLVSLAEAAERTGRHPEVLRRWCQEGRIPGVRIGRSWAVSAETVGLLMRHRGRSRPRLEAADSRR